MLDIVESHLFQKKCVTTKLQLWWLTMAQECAKQGLPVMTLQELSSPPSLEGQDIRYGIFLC